jgi:peroxiredoxin
MIIGAGSTALVAQSASPPTGGASQLPPGVAAGTLAPDGIGVTVGQSPGAGKMANGPWVDESVIQPLRAGATMPANSVVLTVDGKPFDLNAAVAREPTVLMFYRGGWCPYCNAHLRQLQGSMPALQAMGYQVLAISSDTPKELRDTLTKEKLSYQLLSDSKVEVAAKFGLRYKATDGFLDYLKNNHGIDLMAQNGGYLLTPGAFILDRAGVIRFVYANNNFTVRVSQEALLKAARDALDATRP